MLRGQSFILLGFLGLSLVSTRSLAIEEKDKLPERNLFKDEGFISEDLTAPEVQLLELKQAHPSFKALNDSWGWPSSREMPTFEGRVHLDSEVYYSLTPYTDILFRFLANKYDGHPTKLKFDLKSKIKFVSTGRSIAANLKYDAPKAKVTAYLKAFLDAGQNKVLMERLANFEIKSSSSLYFTVAVTSARAFLFIAQGDFDKAHLAIKRLYALWELFEEHNEPKKRHKTGDASDDSQENL